MVPSKNWAKSSTLMPRPASSRLGLSIGCNRRHTLEVGLKLSVVARLFVNPFSLGVAGPLSIPLWSVFRLWIPLRWMLSRSSWRPSGRLLSLRPLSQAQTPPKCPHRRVPPVTEVSLPGSSDRPVDAQRIPQRLQSHRSRYLGGPPAPAAAHPCQRTAASIKVAGAFRGRQNPS